MSDTQFGATITGDAIRAERRARGIKYNFKTVPGVKRSRGLVSKVKAFEKVGWAVVKRNQKSTRLRKFKPAKELLEDDIWCFLADMGYGTISTGRDFEVNSLKTDDSYPFNVFAKDDEVGLFVRCLNLSKLTKKDMSVVLEDLVAAKGRVSKAMTRQYGREAGIKPKFILATNNVEWRPIDLATCAANGIAVITETEIDYYKALAKFLKSAARYQLHAHLFQNAKIAGLLRKVPATRGHMGGQKFYNFLISPDDLLKISYVGHKASRTEEAIKTYQRMLEPKRMQSIADYIAKGGKFPTNIVVNFKTQKQRSLVFETSSPNSEDGFGNLVLPDTFGSAWIIDGQHRLYGYAYQATKEDGPKTDTSVLSVLAFENLPADEEMNMFIDINSKQKKVSAALLNELYADLHWNSANDSEKVLALQSRIVRKLNNQKTSPLYERVKVTGKRKTNYRCLTQTSIADGIAKAGFLGRVTKKDGFVPGPLAHSDPDRIDETLSKATEVIQGILNLFSSRVKGNWEVGDGPGGYLCTNIGIRALFHVINDICTHVEKIESAQLSLMTADGVLTKLEAYLEPLVAYFENASVGDILVFRKVGSSLAAVKSQAMGMNALISNVKTDFAPEGLRVYLQTRNEEGNREAMLMMYDLQQRMYRRVIKTLQDVWGLEDDNWWTSGVPLAIRQSCGNEWEAKDREDDVQSYLSFPHYERIANLNWNDMKTFFAFDERDANSKKKCLIWVGRLTAIRNKTVHPEKKKITDEEIQYVKEIHSKVMKYFPEVEQSDE